MIVWQGLGAYAFRERHSVFFVPLRYRAMLFAGLGLIVFIAGLAQAIGLLPL